MLLSNIGSGIPSIQLFLFVPTFSFFTGLFCLLKVGGMSSVEMEFSVTKRVFVFCLLICVYGETNAGGTTSNSIRRGQRQRDSTPTTDKEFPWEVKLRSLAALRCSGVLLDSRWLLTAASCFEGNYLQPSNYNIELYYKRDGQDISKTSPPSVSIRSSTASSPSSSSSTSTTTIPILRYNDRSIYVESFYLHGRYTEGHSRHNIALVHLHDDVTSRSVFADVIGPRDDVSGDDCVTVGWGSNGTGEPVNPRVTAWTVTNSTMCSQKYNVTVYPDELCAHLLDSGTGVCTGDIGAPLLCRESVAWVLKGIVTHTWRCHGYDQDPQPARFLNLQHYLPFVQKRGNFKGRQSGK